MRFSTKTLDPNTELPSEVFIKTSSRGRAATRPLRTHPATLAAIPIMKTNMRMTKTTSQSKL